MIHTIHIKHDALGTERFDTACAIPEKVERAGLVFAPFWLAANGLWYALALYALFFIGAMALLATPYSAAVLPLLGFPAIYIFLEGNQMKRAALERRGYVMVGIVDATNEEAAVLKFFSDEDVIEPQSEPLGSAPALRREDDLSFGLVGGTGA